MNGNRQTPWAGIALALVTVTLLAWAGLPLLGLLAVAGVWIFSFWADRLRPETEPPVQRLSERPDLDAIARGAMEATIEAISLPMILTDETRILAANAAAREALGNHLVGQDTRVALRHPDAISLLDQPDGASVVAPALTVSDSLWQLTRHSIDNKYRIIEMRDRTAEADMSRAHTDFVANASHELRTPLSSIIGYVETLTEAEDKVDAALTRRFLGTVLREARRMNHLVVDLMSLSQLEADKHDLPAAQIDLNQLAARVVSEFAPEPGGPVKVELEPSGEASGMAVRGDVKQLEQLLRNFIDNALKYGDGETPVKVTLSPGPRDTVQLSVRDAGAGIAPEHLPHLTRRFYRTDPGRSRSVGGTGLGLAICKHIVERHRGRLDIASTLGVGTTVSVRLPLVHEAALARA
ncbi:MAG: two-component sensor histidine kinase [Sphingomonadales bacterium]|nr:two-component sensor histidine kinase [Sphingomonadales bacterium]MDE2169060.1 two-component sensor histidine kinase [Sphingomonadales bacterium]